MLIYLGADVIDNVLTTAKAYGGLYLTQDGDYSSTSCPNLPCNCEVCSKYSVDDLKAMPPAERFALLGRHNDLRLGRGQARQAPHKERHDPGVRRKAVPFPAMADRLIPAGGHAVRLSGAAYACYRSSEMLACSAESQNRVEVRRFAERVNTRFQSEGDILLIIPCSARKPYSTSKSHLAIARALGRYRNLVHELILTSPLGVVPRELELVYPAAHYDVTVTGVWDLEERQWVSDCLKKFVDTHHFKKIIAHVEGPYVEVCKQTGMDMVYTSKGRITSDASLASLMEQNGWRCRIIDQAPRPAPAVAGHVTGNGGL